MPPVNRIRSVEAVLPGAVLISRRLFLQTGGLDETLSEDARWINLCIEGRKNHRAEPAFDPFAAFLFADPPPKVEPGCSPRDIMLLKSRWGNDFLSEADKIYTQDGIFQRKDEKENEMVAGRLIDRLIRWVDLLLSQGRRAEAQVVLDPLMRLSSQHREIHREIAVRRALLDQHEFSRSNGGSLPTGDQQAVKVHS